MTSIPHRYVTPTYPGAAGWDYFNVVSGGVGGSGSAYMDNAKVGSPNAGTYAVAFGEDATSSNANRGLRALAQNCDTLDDLLNRSLATPVRTGDATAGSPVASVTLPTSTFLGVAGTPTTTAGYGLLFEVLDSNDNEIIDATTGAKVQVNAVVLGSGDVIGGSGSNGNFSGNTVQIQFSPSIPTGTVYRIWYGTRASLANLPLDAFTTIRIRGAQEVEAGVEDLFRQLHGNHLAWNASWTSTVYDLALAGLNDRYNRSAVTMPTPPEAYWANGLNLPGSGGWVYRTGPALTMYTAGDDIGGYADPANALFAAKFVDTQSFDSAGITGFVAYGSRRTGTAFTGESLYEPGAATFLALWPHHYQNTVHATNPYTRVLEWATATFSNVGTYNLDTGEAIVQVTQAGNYFRTSGGLSAVALGYDMVECIYNGVRQIYVIVAMGATTDATNVTKVRVRRLDGSVPDFSGTPTGTIRWLSTTFGVGDGAGRYHKVGHGYSDAQAILFDGLFYQVPPNLSAGAEDNVPKTAASFSAADTTAATKALQWGGFQRTQPSGPVFPSYLTGDGGVFVGAADIVAAGTSNSMGAVKGNYLILNTLPTTTGITSIGPLVSAGPWLMNFDASLGSYRDCTASATTQVFSIGINITNVRKGATLVLTLDHSGLSSTGAVSLDWTNGNSATVTSRFGPGDDQPPVGPGRTKWTGIARTATEVWWTVTRIN